MSEVDIMELQETHKKNMQVNQLVSTVPTGRYFPIELNVFGSALH